MDVRNDATWLANQVELQEGSLCAGRHRHGRARNHGCRAVVSAAVSGSRVSAGVRGVGEEGRDDVGRVSVERASGAVAAAGLAWVGVSCEVLHVAQAAAGIERGRDGWVAERVGEMGLSIPARFASRRTIRPAACRSRRVPPLRASSGPSVRSPTAASIARAVRGASGMSAGWLPLPMMLTTRCPLANARSDSSAPQASDTRRAFSASRQARALSLPPDSPAWTRNAPSSERSSPSRVDSGETFGRRTSASGSG